MGVIGLTSYIKTSLTSYSDHIDLSNNNKTIIVIDGNAFAYFFLHEDELLSAYNCDYNSLSKRLFDWIIKFQKANVEIIFIFDGIINDDKLHIKIKRFSNQIEELHNKLVNINKNTYEKIPKFYNILPLFMIDCIIEVCHSCNVRTFFAKNEADKILALFAKSINATAILSNDTDFLIYNMGNVGLMLSNGYGFADDGTLHGYIIRRNKLACINGLSPDNLHYIPAIVGNDISNKVYLREIQSFLRENYDDNNKPKSKHNDKGKKKKKKIKTDNNSNMIIDNDYESTNDDEDIDYFNYIESLILSNDNNSNNNHDHWHNQSALKMITSTINLLKKAEFHIKSRNNNKTNNNYSISPEKMVEYLLNVSIEDIDSDNTPHRIKHISKILLTVFR